MSRSIGALVGALAVVIPSNARSEPGQQHTRDAARDLANDAANAFARAEFVRAHELCRQAYELVPAPTIALLDARSLVRLGRLVEADQAYALVVAHELTPTAPPPFERAVHQAKVERARLARRLAKLKIIVSDMPRAGALSVRFDDRDVPKPLFGTWVQADPREHTVQISLNGKVQLSETIRLTEGDSRVLYVQTPSAAPSADPLRTWGYVGLGVGATGLALGVLTGIAAMNAHADVERFCSRTQCIAGTAGADALDRFRTYRAASTLSYAVGAAAAGFGAIALFWPRSSEQSSLSISASANGIWLGGSL